MPIPGSQAEVAAYLTALSGAPPLETHISAVFRGADTVWKLKKAVRLSFLDFSTLEARRHYVAREFARRKRLRAARRCGSRRLLPVGR